MKNMYVLLILSGVDYISGVIRAVIEKRLSSSVGYKGILKKVLMFGIVGVSFCLNDILGGGVFTLVSTFYIANESLSLIENSVSCGIPCPQALKEALIVLHNKAEKGGKEDEYTGKTTD